MLKTTFCMLLFAALLMAQSTEKLLNYVPGEIIIKYEKIGESPRGSEIIREQKDIVGMINTKLPEIITDNYSPVFKSVIEEMINKNKTEEELREDRGLNKSLKRIQSSNKVINFSTALLLKTNDVNENIEDLVKKINNNPNLFSGTGLRIVYAEPNYLKVANKLDSDDPLYSKQWAHRITNIEEAWKITKGSPIIKIAIIDSGVDPNHPDLSSNISRDGYDFVGIDLTKYSGYTTVPGEDYTGEDSDFSDYNGHGTHCAGIVAAIGDNGIGVKGVAPGCQILPLRAGFSMKLYNVENAYLETTAIVNAINYAVNHNANIISMSFGGNYSELEEEAIQYAYSRNVVLIAAAGNSNSMMKSYPAGYDEVFSVTSIDSTKFKSSFSNFGYWTNIAAPGGNIISTVPSSGGANTDASGYKVLSGTSMAAPYIAGVAALILSQNPSMTNDEVYQTLLSSVDPYNKSGYDVINNTDKYIGTGFVNAYKALSNDEPCISKINSPNVFDNYIARGDFDVSGKAYGKNFSKYIFEYRNYLDENGSWKTIGSYYSTSVDSGFLGKVSIPEDGIYYLRLDVINTNNQNFTDIIGPITIDSKMKANWPISTGYESVSSPVISDIDNDGVMETIFTSSNGGVYVVGPTGNNKTGWPVMLTNVNDVQGIVGYSSPAVGDIDNDGKEEIVVRDGQNLFVFDYKGQTKPGWPREMGWIIGGNAMISSPVLADINGDNKKEIIVTFRGDNGNDGRILVMDYHGNYLTGWPLTLSSRMTSTISPVVCDLDGDGNPEIIIQCYDNDKSLGYMYVLNKYGNILPGWPKQFGGGAWNSPIAADINNDGKNEIIACTHIGTSGPGKIGVFVFDKEGNILKGWPASLDYAQYGYYDIEPGISVGDINNDGYKEILVASEGYTYSLFALNKDAKLMWSSVSKDFEYVKNSSPLIADINGDGKPEIIVTKLNNLSLYGKVVVFDNNGKEINSLSRVIPDRIRATPTIGDIDGDNKLELVCASQNGNVYCWDYDAPYDPAKLIWPTYQQNNLRTGTFIIQPISPSVTQLIEPLDNSINQKTKIKFSWNPSDWALKYHFQLSDDELFSKIIYEDTSVTEVNHEVDSLKNGTKYFWRVSASNKYGNGEWSTVRKFTTIFAAPDKVVLEYPTDNSNKIKLPINMKWHKSVLAVKYWIQISLDSNFIKTSVNDSTITDTVKNFSNLENNTKYYWRVCAKNAGGVSAWSPTWKFTTIVQIPNIPLLVKPAKDSKNVDVNAKLVWKKSLFSTTYNLYVAKDNKMADIITHDSTLTDTLKAMESLKEGTKYYWKVNSKNEAGNSNFSEIWNFTTYLNEPDSLVAFKLEKGKIEITWRDHSQNESGFKIEKKVNNEFILLDSVGTNITSYIDTTALSSGSYYYRIYAFTMDAVSKLSNETLPIVVNFSNQNLIPTKYSLFQNYPNPFNPTTTIKYELPRDSFVSLIVFNVIGEEVAVLVNGERSAGSYRINFDGSNLASGIYYYRILAGDYTETKKFILLK